MNQNKNFKNKNTRTPKNDRPKNIELNIPVVFGDAVNNQSYSDESAINALVHLNDQILPYINIPLNVSRAIATGDENKKGVTSIGYMNSYNKEDNTMKVVVYSRNQEIVDTMQAKGELGLTIRCVAKDNELTRFVSFEIANV